MPSIYSYSVEDAPEGIREMILAEIERQGLSNNEAAAKCDMLASNFSSQIRLGTRAVSLRQMARCAECLGLTVEVYVGAAK